MSAKIKMSSIQLVMYSNYLILMDSVLGMCLVRMVKNGYITVKTNSYVFLIKKAENEILNQILKKEYSIHLLKRINSEKNRPCPPGKIGGRGKKLHSYC